uniref:Hydrophobin n=1 Tax=Panagrellus redivivus TaxID=6233 RepID=A0A7E4WC37_PANRE
MLIVGIGCDSSELSGSCCPIYPQYDLFETCAAKYAAKNKRSADFDDAMMSIAIFFGFIMRIIYACRDDS